MDDALPPIHSCPTLGSLVIEHGLKDELVDIARWEERGREERRTAVFGPGCKETGPASWDPYEPDHIPGAASELTVRFPSAQEIFLAALRLTFVERGARREHRGWLRKYFGTTWVNIAHAKAHADARLVSMEDGAGERFGGYTIHISPVPGEHYVRFRHPVEEQDRMDVDAGNGDTFTFLPGMGMD